MMNFSAPYPFLFLHTIYMTNSVPLESQQRDIEVEQNLNV